MREKFPIFKKRPELIYLDSAATSQKPQEVVDAISHFYVYENATVHRAIYQSAVTATEKFNDTRELVKTFLNAAFAEEIVFTRGTTDALNLVACSYGARLQKGDEILISEMEHHSNIVPWQMLRDRTGATLRIIPMNGDGLLEWEGKITPRTKIVSIAHISNVTGTINPIRAIGEAAHRVGAVLVVDGAQAAPHLPIDVRALGADFYAFSGHKCYGPTGVGVLYGRLELLESMPPIQGGGDMIETVTFEKTTYRSPPLCFEAGTPMIAEVIGLAAALRFLMKMGMENVRDHGKKLLKCAQKELGTIPGLRILGNAPERGPLLTFTVGGMHPLDVATLLDLKGIAVRSGHLCAQPLLHKFGLTAAVRASFGLYNTEDEIRCLSDAICKLV